MMRCMAVGPVLLPTTRTRLVPFVPRAARYGFGEVRIARLALLIFTAMSGSHSCGVVTTKFSDHVVTFRSSPTVFADTPVPASISTCILAGKPPRAMSSAAMLLHLYRGIGSSLIARLLSSQPLKCATCVGATARDARRLPDNKLDVVPNALGWRAGRSNSAILPRASRDKRGNGTPVRPSLLREWAWVPSADALPCLRVQARQRVLGEPRSQRLGNAVAGQPLTMTFVDDREQPPDLSKAGSRQPRRVTRLALLLGGDVVDDL